MIHRTEQTELRGRFEWLLLFRIVIYTSFVGSALVFRLFETEASEAGAHLLYVLITSYALTVVYALYLRKMEHGFRLLGYVQLVFDVMISATLVAITGGISSFFSVLYLLTVISASILMDRRDAFVILALMIAVVVFQVTCEVSGLFWITHPAGETEQLDILLAGITRICAVFLVTLLTGYLTQQLRDVGQKLRSASQDIESLRALNEQIINTISSGLMSFTADREIIFVNPAACKIIGYRQEDLLFSDALNLFPSVTHRLNNQSEQQWETEFRRPDGEYRVLSLALSELDYKKHERVGWTLIFADLSPLRTMEEHVRRSERLAAIGKMAAGIAHEIRNPLASMNGSIQLLADSLQLDPTENRLMRIVRREADRLNQLVSDFLRYARPNPAHFETVSISNLLDELVLIFGYLHHGTEQPTAKYNYSVNIEKNEALDVEGDAKQLRQVFWNLLNNAAQSMVDGGEVIVEGQIKHDLVSVTVTDHGHGIDADDLQRIFDPFYTTKDTGTGLGLALVQRVVEDHNGRILVDSKPDSGTTVTILLPVKQPIVIESESTKEVVA